MVNNICDMVKGGALSIYIYIFFFFNFFFNIFNVLISKINLKDNNKYYFNILIIKWSLKRNLSHNTKHYH